MCPVCEEPGNSDVRAAKVDYPNLAPLQTRKMRSANFLISTRGPDHDGSYFDSIEQLPEKCPALEYLHLVSEELHFSNWDDTEDDCFGDEDGWWDMKSMMLQGFSVLWYM